MYDSPRRHQALYGLISSRHRLFSSNQLCSETQRSLHTLRLRAQSPSTQGPPHTLRLRAQFRECPSVLDVLLAKQLQIYGVPMTLPSNLIPLLAELKYVFQSIQTLERQRCKGTEREGVGTGLSATVPSLNAPPSGKLHKSVCLRALQSCPLNLQGGITALGTGMPD